MIQSKNIPEVARSSTRSAETFRVQTANLTLIQGMYNEMLRKMLDVEKPLLKGQMKAIDKVLDKGLKVLVWKSPNKDKDDFIAEANTLVQEAHKTLFEMKDNMEAIKAILTKWVAAPLMTRASNDEDLQPGRVHGGACQVPRGAPEGHHRRRQGRALVPQGVQRGAQGLQGRAGVARVRRVHQRHPRRRHRRHGRRVALAPAAQIDPAQIEEDGKSPFFDVKLDLNPSWQGRRRRLLLAAARRTSAVAARRSVMGYVTAIKADFFNVVKLIKRLDRAEGDFLKEMEEHEDVRFHVHRIIDECAPTRPCATSTAKPFLSHKNLWAKTSTSRCRSSSRRGGLQKAEGPRPREGGEDEDEEERRMPEARAAAHGLRRAKIS